MKKQNPIQNNPDVFTLEISKAFQREIKLGITRISKKFNVSREHATGMLLTKGIDICEHDTYNPVILDRNGMVRKRIESLKLETGLSECGVIHKVCEFGLDAAERTWNEICRQCEGKVPKKNGWKIVNG